MKTLEQLKAEGEAPEWLSIDGYQMLNGGYLWNDETPKAMYHRVAAAVASSLKKPELADKFFNIMWKNWLCPSTPVLSNAGTDRGLPISCLTGDSWVNTKSGGKQIKDIQLGDLVLTHKGRWRSVISKTSQQSKDPIYVLKVRTRMTPIKITGNHLVLTNLGWVRVDELDASKHWIAVNKDIEFEEKNYIISLKEYCPYSYKEHDDKICKIQQTKSNRKRDVLKEQIVSYYSQPYANIPVDEEVAWALGLWFAEGSRTRNHKKLATGIRITIGSDEEHYAKRFLRIMKEKFNLNGNYYLSKRPNPNKPGYMNSWISVNVNGRLIGEFFDKEFGVGCKNKQIPQWIIDLPKPILKSFVQGLLDGDGSRSASGTDKITLTNGPMILGMYNSLLKLNIPCSLQMQTKASKHSKDSFVYTIDMYNGYDMSKARKRPSVGIQFENNLYAPIASLIKTDMKEEVFDIGVEEDHSFSVSGVVVHNCFSSYMADDTYEILETLQEVAMLSKYGGGTAIHVNDVRAKGAPISKGGHSDGVVPFLKMADSVILGISQGSTRRGACAAYIDIEHGDFDEFLQSRRPTGDVNRQCLNLHHGVCVSNAFIDKVKAGDPEARRRWKELVKSRVETGEPYVFFTDNANDQAPPVLKETGIKLKGSNLCVTGDQLVVTSKGLRSVLDLVNSGEELTLFDGTKTVNASPMKLIEKNVPVYRITTKTGRTHDVTSYHKIKTTRGMVACEELKAGDKIFVQRKEGLFGNVHKPELAFLLGLYHADGTQTDKCVYIDIWENDFKLRSEIEESVKLVYTQENWLQYNIKNQTGTIVGKRKTKIPTFIRQNTGTSSVQKLRLGSSKLKKFGFEKGVIPDWIYQGDKETISQYLRGLYIADGTINVSKSHGNPLYLSLASIDRNFLGKIQIILSNLGIESKIYCLRKAGKSLLPDGKGGSKYYNTKDCWRLNISNKTDAIKFDKLTGYLTYKGKSIQERKYRDNTQKNDEVISVTYLNNQDVYCTTVDSKEHIWVCNSFITSNCSEIFLPTDKDHTFVCCLSSLNLARWDEWKDTDTVQLSVWFLDGIMEEFIQKASKLRGFERALRFAVKSRALGLGVLGLHSYFQKNMIAFDSLQAYLQNKIIFKKIREEAELATAVLATEYGEPEWCKGHARRNATLMAIAPTVSNSLIASNVSQGIEPWIANAFAQKSAKGTFVRRNPELEKLLKSIGQDTDEVWGSILKNDGSVQHLECLTAEQKEVFLTARELNQFAIIKLAAERQKFIDQGQSINIFFPANSDPKYINQVHLEAANSGLKSLYYLRSTSVLKAEQNSNAVYKRELTECSWCEG